MSRPDQPSHARGVAAEDLAAAFLRLSGHEILERNVRIGGGEIDLIAQRGQWLFLVEVRYRGSTRYGHPIETLADRKRRALARSARAYIARRGWADRCWRIDAVTVVARTDGSVIIRRFPRILQL
jgi:putative endonuclease